MTRDSSPQRTSYAAIKKTREIKLEKHLQHTAAVRVAGRKGVWFMFDPGTDHVTVNLIAKSLEEHAPPYEAKVVELYHTEKDVKTRCYGIALDPNDTRVSAALTQKNESSGTFLRPHIGGEELPELEFADAAKQVLTHFAQHGRAAGFVADSAMYLRLR